MSSTSLEEEKIFTLNLTKFKSKKRAFAKIARTLLLILLTFLEISTVKIVGTS